MKADKAMALPRYPASTEPNLPYAKSAEPMAEPPTVMNATVGINVSIVRRVASAKSASTEGMSSAAALRESRGITTVSTVTPIMPNGSISTSHV